MTEWVQLTMDDLAVRSGSVGVFNLRTGDWQTYVGILPSQAVVAAYAQSQGDWNTWNYETNYRDKGLVRFGQSLRTVFCGDFAARQ